MRTEESSLQLRGSRRILFRALIATGGLLLAAGFLLGTGTLLAVGLLIGLAGSFLLLVEAAS